ncbi:hypothetical protein HPB47_009611 [Ixodes persulcatus]|uniref:Uncharacterized protein n=1 Tax=Ixodes persulcatus TaxID=34615 RepID=A0AC60P1C9_IXOPE|nr:hypothetical protein HPB47_009611 [Ixodes persulcatus]
MEDPSAASDAESVLNFTSLQAGNDYDSNFETDSEADRRRSGRRDLAGPAKPRREPKAHRDVVLTEYSLEEKRREKHNFLALDAYTRHKKLINDYLLCYPGTTAKLQRDTSRDRTDFDVIRENHQFLWDEADEDVTSWEKQLAKRYYDKLFKEYCICDLTYYKANKIAMRWRTEQELIVGKGQFSCGEKRCKSDAKLRTWEVNFGYFEKDEKKNALVKLRLCAECSFKLNYRFQRKELTKPAKRTESESGGDEPDPKRAKTVEEPSEAEKTRDSEKKDEAEDSVWKKPGAVEEEKSKEEEFDLYLSDMFL